MPVRSYCVEEPVGVRLTENSVQKTVGKPAPSISTLPEPDLALSDVPLPDVPLSDVPLSDVPLSEKSGGGEDSRSPAELSDLELVEGVKRASEAHFNELYERYFQRVYSFVQSRLRNHCDAEEVTQETFVTIFKSMGNYRGQSSLLSWMFGIARNLSNNMIRRSQNQRERFESVDKEHFAPKASINQGAPDDVLSLQRYAQVIGSRMSSLPEWQRRVFEMRHLENMSIPEIAKTSCRSNDAVRSSLYRMKKLIFEAVDAPGEAHAR